MRTLIILILIYIAYRLIKRTFYKIPHVEEHHGTHAPGAEGGAAGEEDMALDPVCGSYVPLSTAITADFEGRKKYFCSPECRDKFIASLEK